jgi:hypothetical protein
MADYIDLSYFEVQGEVDEMSIPCDLVENAITVAIGWDI